MSSSNVGSEIEGELSKEKQNLLEKLSNIFDPETAYDYVCPKTNENRQQLSLEELRRLNYNQQEENLQRLRSLVHYKTTTQSLSRADLEASYQSFVRDQVARQSPRYELEQYVRNSSDIDSAKRYVDMANDVLVNPQQSLLLFRSSKLNEQKANLLKSSRYSNSLQQLNDDLSLQKYFSETLHNTSKNPIQDEEEFFNSKKPPTRLPSMHLEYKEKKVHVKFLKDYDEHNEIYRRKTNRHLFLKKQLTTRDIESLFSTENSTIQGQPSELNTSTIHRETFPPLSLSALKEYRPSVTPKPPLSRRTSSLTNKIQQRRKSMRKADFIWNQSIVSSTTHE
ncbi:unnamed protein product [Rotaria sordida]|nr:unnamed protein product [Rotaria sordida]CAF0977634.1 unnamed protein product [Rotaria sordida]CAF1022958.1 unnamed protein product [Rotaria sordida]CAF1110161.1 unnamed protein product [Rotaria sordida]